MKHLNIVGVDLAKNVIQVCVMRAQRQEVINRSYSRTKFAVFLVKQQRSVIAFEACASSHYWARKAKALGHTIKIIPAKAITPYRQGHKTDINDARAIAEAASRPHLLEAPLKSVEQQGLQAVQRSRELLVQERTGLSNHIRGILMEFGIVIPKGFAALHQQIPEVLEDGENELPDLYRPTLQILYERLVQLKTTITILDQQIAALIKQHPGCETLMKIEGVGPISAILLYASLGSGDAFSQGRQYAAYLGLTPKQYSSGGKTNLIGISKKVANKRLRSVLIQGARAYVHKLKEPKSQKDRWLLALIERAGYGKAAVALANKNVRTAWAMLTRGTTYNKQHTTTMHIA